MYGLQERAMYGLQAIARATNNEQRTTNLMYGLQEQATDDE